MTSSFGSLTVGNRKKYDIRKILNSDSREIDYLFGNLSPSLERLNVIQAERRMALENLRNLTIKLQTRRLRYKVKSACKYFTL